MMRRALYRATALVRDPRGATILEFGLISPMLCMVLMTCLDFAHSLYMQAVLQGAVQKAARDSSLQSGGDTTQQDTLDARVVGQVQLLNKNATVAITRRYYRTFSTAAAAQAETFTDTTSGAFADGKCNNGEPYMDANNNSRFDRDGADQGQGGARDIVVYTATITYPRLFPVDKFIPGMSGANRFAATTVLANQPFGDQAQYGTPTVRNCGVGVAGQDAPTP